MRTTPRRTLGRAVALALCLLAFAPLVAACSGDNQSESGAGQEIEARLVPAEPLPADLPDDASLGVLINQPVARTMAEAGAVQLTEADYARVALAGDRPMMVLVYSDGEGCGNQGGQRGLAALALLLRRHFGPGLGVAAYAFGDDCSISVERFSELRELFAERGWGDLRGAPALLFYDNGPNGAVLEKRFNGGIGDIGFLKMTYARFLEPMRTGFMDD